MKKLEALLNKLEELFSVEGMRPHEVVETLIALALMIVFEGIFIWVAIVSKFYFPLSIMTFMWVWMITECCINKVFLKKLNNYLLETPKATTLVFWILLIFSIILSCKYFIGFIFSVILAFMVADFKKNKKK